MNKSFAEILNKITKGVNTDKLWDLVMELWDLESGTARERKAKKEEVLKMIHKLHNELFAVEQMLEDIK